MINKTQLEKNLERFINNNYDKKDRDKTDSIKFEWFVNTIHVWHCSSQFYNLNPKIGKDISLGTSQGGDAFLIIVNEDKIFTIYDNPKNVIEYINEKGKEVTFQFIQTKKSKNADQGGFLKFTNFVLSIIKGMHVDIKTREIELTQNLYNEITNGNSIKYKNLKRVKHKLELFFYIDKNENDILALKNDWKAIIDSNENNLREYIPNTQIIIRGSKFLNDIYELFTSNKYELFIDKNEVNEVNDKKCLFGYITASELLDCIAPNHNGERNILSDVFKNNIRLYIGNTPVNESIEKTLREEPEKFHYYNNGLTITTKTINGDNTKMYKSTPINSVNGCQTANSIFKVFRKDHKNENIVKIPIHIIVAEDDEYENITIRTNSQNGIKEKDLVSITTIQKELEEEFNKIKFCSKSFFYKRQNSEDDKTDIDFIIRIDDILRASFSTLMLIPNKVSGFFDQTTIKYLDILFIDIFSKLYIDVTALYKITEYEIDDSCKELKRLKFHLTYLLYKFLNKQVDLNQIEKYFRNKITNKDSINEAMNELVRKIHSNIYEILKSQENFKKIFKYIVSRLKEEYPSLLDLNSKTKEKILYKPVEKLFKTRAKPTFNNFNEVFTKNISDIIGQDK